MPLRRWALLSLLLSPYEDLGAFKGRFRVSVPRMGAGEAAATALNPISTKLDQLDDEGYGSNLLARSVADQYGGTITCDWFEKLSSGFSK